MQSYITIRIEKELREAFHDKAKENAQTPSKLVRKFIEDYVKENQN